MLDWGILDGIDKDRAFVIIYMINAGCEDKFP